MTLFRKNKEGIIECTVDGRLVYTTDELAIVYSRGPSGCTILKHGPAGILREYFLTTVELAERTLGAENNSIGLVRVASEDMSKLAHVANTAAIDESNFLTLAEN